MPISVATLEIILTTTTITCVVLNPKGPTYQNYSTSCIMEIIQQQFNESDIIQNKLLTFLTTPNMSTTAFGVQNNIIEKTSHLLKWSLEILNGDQIDFESSEICLNCPVEGDDKEVLKNIFQPNYKTRYCLMVVDNLEHFSEGLQNYLKSAILSIPAFFLVYVTEINSSYEYLAEYILITLWDYKIINAAVVIAINNLRTFNIYGLDSHVRSETCVTAPRFRLMDSCKKGKVAKNIKLFGNKLPSKFYNCSIDTMAVKYPPFVINEENGFEINVLKELGNILNISFSIAIEENAVDWGTRISKNNWTGPLQGVLDNSAIAIGNVKADPDIAEDFGLSMEYFHERMVWVVPMARPMPRWKNIFVIFGYQLWLTCIACFIITALIFQVTSGSKEELPRYKHLGTNFMTSLCILVGIATPEGPKTMVVRTAFMSLAVYSIYVILLYQTLLITFLTNPVYEHQISTVEDILDSKKAIGGLESYRDYFNVTADERAMKIYHMFKTGDQENDTAYNWISMVADYRNICTISNAFYVRYLLAEYDRAVTNSHGLPKIFVMKEILFTYPIRMVLPKGYPLAKKFNTIIGYLVNGGIVEQWAKRYHQHIAMQIDSSDDHGDDDVTAITLDHLQGAFSLLWFGHAFGVGFLLLELICNRIGKTKKYHRLKKYFKKNYTMCKRKNK